MSVKVLVRSLPAFALPDIHIGQDLLEAIELLVHLLKPASLAAFVLALWRFSSDLGWTSEFVVSDGLLSHWQIWAVIGLSMLGLQSLIANRLARKGTPDIV